MNTIVLIWVWGHSLYPIFKIDVRDQDFQDKIKCIVPKIVSKINVAPEFILSKITLIFFLKLVIGL